MEAKTPGVRLQLARICAVALSIAIVGYLVACAGQRAKDVGTQPAEVEHQEPQQILMPSSKDPGPDTLLLSSKSATLPSSKSATLSSSKSLVLPAELDPASMLYSSKSGEPVPRTAGAQQLQPAGGQR